MEAKTGHPEYGNNDLIAMIRWDNVASTLCGGIILFGSGTAVGDIYFKCRCGKSLAIDEAGLGRMVDCPECGYQFMIPTPVLKWACPGCGASMLAPEEMRGETVQCLSCQTEVRAPDRDAQEEPAAESSVPPEAPGSESLSSHLNKLFLDCPQCHERVPVNTRECPHCGHAFCRPALRGAVLGGLGLVILAGIVLGLWQAEIWPFSPAPQPLPAPPAPSVRPAPQPVSNAVAAAVAPTGKTETAVLAPPVPAAVPVDTNAVSPEEWAARFEFSRQVTADRMDKAYPRGELNRNIELRLLNGLMVHGTNTGLGTTNLTLVVDGQPRAIAFQDLDAYARLKVDMDFRSTWIAAQAAALSRRSLEKEGKKIPGVSPHSEEDPGQALGQGDPRAQYQAAEQLYKRKDFTQALLYFRAAAGQDHPAAQYALGVMYYKGIGAGANRKEGLTWLALAAAQGYAKAEQFIQQNKISQDVRQRLLKEEQVRKEAAGREFEAAWKAYQELSRVPSPVPDSLPAPLQGSSL